jgi:hypothetical protein
MQFDVRKFRQLLDDNDIYVSYSGPVWANGIDGFSEVLIKRLEFDDVPFGASQSVFSVFVEQINNMMMYSAEKEYRNDPAGNPLEVSKGIFILGIKDSGYFVYSGNIVTDSNAYTLRERIDHLNTLDKKELRQYHRERMKAENENPESKGAGLGLIEVARRASSPIEYDFSPYGEGHQYFSMYVVIPQGGKE